MTDTPDIEIAGRCHYRGDVRDSEYIVGQALDGTVLRALDATYDEAADRTTVTFMVERDPQWRALMAQEAWAQTNLHLMFPEFAPAPGARP